jgi:hypothetical protein
MPTEYLPTPTSRIYQEYLSGSLRLRLTQIDPIYLEFPPCFSTPILSTKLCSLMRFGSSAESSALPTHRSQRCCSNGNKDISRLLIPVAGYTNKHGALRSLLKVSRSASLGDGMLLHISLFPFFAGLAVFLRYISHSTHYWRSSLREYHFSNFRSLRPYHAVQAL